MSIDLKPASAPDRAVAGPVRARVALPQAAEPARSSTGIAAASQSLAAIASPTASPTASPSESTSLAAKSERYNHWGLISQAQSRIASLQAAEQALVSAYRQLLQVSRQLEQSAWISQAGQSTPLADRIDQLAREVRTAPATLDQNLKPKVLQADAGRARYNLTRIDLLTPRNQPERLQLMFSGMRQAVELDLPAGAGTDQALAVIRQALQPLQVQAALNGHGQLEFSVAAGEQSRLNAPLLVTGQGIRVPAGNPVPVQLDVAPGPLDTLAAGLRSGDLAPQRQRIGEMLTSLQNSQRQLQQQSQQIVARLDRVRGAVAAVGDAVEVGRELAHVMRGASFGQHVAILLAQANVSRHLAVAIMAR